MTEKELAQCIYEHMSKGYFLSPTGRWAIRKRAELAASEIAPIQRQAQQQPTHRTVRVQPPQEVQA